MIDDTRRTLLGAAFCATAIPYGIAYSQASSEPAAAPYSDPAAADAWMTALIDAPPAISGPFHMGKFVDRMYYMLEEIGWEPSGSQKKLGAVTVPKGFTCDLTSIPRIFWSLLPPDGPYAFAAVIHDYLYWFQTKTKDEADLVLRYAMEDLKVDPSIVEAIHLAVKYGGSSAWKMNTGLRKAGEKRVLKRYPKRPDVTWTQWSKQAGSL